MAHLSRSLTRFNFAPGGPRPPLRTCCELAEELGTTPMALGKALQKAGIQPLIDNRKVGAANRAVWYDPRIVRAFWKEKNSA